MIYRYLAVAIIASVLLGSGYGYGVMAGTKKYEPQLAALRAALDTADALGKAQIAKGKEALDAAKKSNDANIAAIKSRYARLLVNAKNSNGTMQTSASAVGVDATGSEQSVAGCSPEFEQSCILDANKVTQWQEWARRNQIPIAD